MKTLSELWNRLGLWAFHNLMPQSYEWALTDLHNAMGLCGFGTTILYGVTIPEAIDSFRQFAEAVQRFKVEHGGLDEAHD